MSVTNSQKSKVNEKLTGRTISSRGNAFSNGSIAEIIGTGENAKNSLIWITIVASFSAGGLFSIFLYARSFVCDIGFSLIEDLKSLWSIFVPLITLALGYSFGKGSK
jgi:hypothetical protein